MRTFNTYTEDALNFAFSRQGSVLGPGLGQYDPVADLNAQSEKEVKKSDLDQIERYADRLFASLGIDVEFTRHFLDRVNDARNVKQITSSELTRLFKQTYKKHGKTISKLGDDAEAVINDMKTDINMPFVLNLKGGELELIAKTVMRKKNFKTSNRKLSFESYIEKQNIVEEKDHKKDYETFAQLYTKINKAVGDASKELNKITSKNQGPMGLTDPKVKSSPKYKIAKSNYNRLDTLRKKFLKGVPKDFMRKFSQRREGIGETKQEKEYVKDIARAMRGKGHENLKKYADDFEINALKSKDPEKELKKIPNIKRGQIANLLNMSEGIGEPNIFSQKNPRIPRKKGQPAGSKKHSDLYTDENPKGTIHGLKFATVDDAEDSVRKIENSDRTHAHKIQAAVAMEQRAREMGKTSAADVYRRYINKMKEKTKEMQKEDKEDAELAKDIALANKKAELAKSKKALKDKHSREKEASKKSAKDVKGRLKLRQDRERGLATSTAKRELGVIKGKRFKEELEFFPKKVHRLVTLPEPPTNTEREIEIVKKIMDARTSEDEQSIKDHDPKPFYAIEKYCEDNGMKFHKNEFRDVVNSVLKPIKHFKKKFNRPRPYQVDKSIKPLFDTDTTNTRSYPSGHACQSMIVGLYVAGKFPTHRKSLIEVAKKGGMTRVQAGFHFLSDFIAGNLLAEKLYMVMSKDDYGKYIDEAPDTSDAMKRYKSGKAGFTDIAHLKAKGLIKRSDGTKKKSDKYK